MQDEGRLGSGPFPFLAGSPDSPDVQTCQRRRESPGAGWARKGALPGEQEDPMENRGWASRPLTAAQHNAWNVSLAGEVVGTIFPLQKEKDDEGFQLRFRELLNELGRNRTHNTWGHCLV